ncbi:hypothetical protein AYI70_g854 [Smittium culicis]|uniref:Uncharacterized protein n=2 Tax=Smittium culicis TaxID=133412 RepID=A0A1R1Y556_9FUNG|nr:hypothetical protein AYI69_g5561 [Smittium culicis]OMJ25510.1 hypothetical protein AYI70_g854 [Smittium culicis]
MFKQVKKVSVKFSPFKKSSTSSRVFLNRIMTKDNISANPNCTFEISTDIPYNASPAVVVEFKDGKVMDIQPKTVNGDQIYSSVYKYAKKLKDVEEMGR